MNDAHDASTGRVNDLFIVSLMQRAYGYGSSLFRIEAALPLVSEGLGVKSEMLVTGQGGQFVFWDRGIDAQRSYVVRLPEADPDLSKMVAVGQLAESVSGGTVPVEQATTRLDEITSAPPRFGLMALGLGFGLIGAGVAVMFSTQWFDVGFGLLAGILAFVLVLLGMRWPWLGGTIQLSTGFVSAVVFTGVAHLVTGSNPFVMVICAVAVYIPGFVLSLGLTELFMGYPVSGLVRLTTAILVTLKLFAGAAIGTALAVWLWGEPPPPEPISVSLPVLFAFIAVLMVGVGVVFQVRSQDMLWVVVTGLVTYAALTAGNEFGVGQGAFLGGLALGLFSNIWARVTGLPSTVVKLPGVMVLMPGVVAYIGVFDAQVVGAEALAAAAGTILQTVFWLIAGLVVAGALVRPWVPSTRVEQPAP